MLIVNSQRIHEHIYTVHVSLASCYASGVSLHCFPDGARTEVISVRIATEVLMLRLSSLAKSDFHLRVCKGTFWQFAQGRKNTVPMPWCPKVPQNAQRIAPKFVPSDRSKSDDLGSNS